MEHGVSSAQEAWYVIEQARQAFITIVAVLLLSDVLALHDCSHPRAMLAQCNEAAA